MGCTRVGAISMKLRLDITLRWEIIIISRYCDIVSRDDIWEIFDFFFEIEMRLRLGRKKKLEIETALRLSSGPEILAIFRPL